MDLLDSTITQVAAPTIRRELGGSYAVIEWVTAAYALAMAVGLLTGGRLGDIFGRRRMLLTGMAGFVAALAACAAAATAGELHRRPGGPGLLGAIMLPQVFGLIRDLFAAHEMGKAVGVYGPVMGLSAMLGPIASGGLISADVFGTGWRMIFAVNVPVGLAALVLGARLLPAGAKPAGAGSGGARRGRLDPPGALLAGAAMFLLVFPLAQGHSLGWPAWLYGMLAASVLALAGFGWYQIRRQRAGRDPLVEPSLFRHGPYRAGIVFSIVFTGSLGGIVMIFNVKCGAGGTGVRGAIAMRSGRRWPPGGHRGGRAAGDRRGAAHRGRRRLHRGPAGPDGDRRDRDGHGVRAAVRHRDGGRPAAGDGLGLRRPADGELARHVARHRIGAIFFALAGRHGGHVPVYLSAAEWTALATAGCWPARSRWRSRCPGGPGSMGNY